MSTIKYMPSRINAVMSSAGINVSIMYLSSLVIGLSFLCMTLHKNALYILQEPRDGLLQHRVHKLRRYIRQGFKDETSLMHHWVWYLQVFILNYAVIVKENVYVNCARPPPLFVTGIAVAAQGLLDPLNHS